MANAKVYIHELVEIIGHRRAEYMEHMTAGWGPIGRRERNQLCVGVWGTVGSTERWPETVNLWELDGWDGAAANFRHELSHAGLQDPSLAKWWAEAASMRRGGFDRLLVPAPYTPTLEEALAAGIGGDVYYHELVSLVPGQARNYLSMLEQEWLPVADRIGLRLMGAYRSTMCNDSEAVVIYAMDSWDAWAGVERAYEDDSEVTAWRKRGVGVVVDWRAKLMVDSPRNPLRTGAIL